MKSVLFPAAVFLSIATVVFSQESLPPLSGAGAPKNFEELWAGYDPRAEPLDTEVLKEWEEDGVVLRVVRYRIGIFKGKKAMMAAVYGFPKGATKLPGLVNIHGGGQYADYRSVLTNAKRGYATITIAWAGRISAPGYRVSPAEVKLFHEGKTDDPAYKVTTDWGALDAYHAPAKHDGPNAFVAIPDGTKDWHLDAEKSPRNNSWFLCTLGARRALTFLEHQSEVDPEKLGVYGHSMGGKLTVLTAGSDSRVKAAAPSCGGISDRYNEDPMHRNTVGDSPALRNISCPTVFLSPSNDFHGRIHDLVAATGELGKNPWRVTCSPHLNHRDSPKFEVATQLWFDQYLKGTFSWPKTPEARVNLKTQSGTPTVSVVADSTKPVLAVDVYYTQQGFEGGESSHHENRKNRFWHHAATQKRGQTWTAELPVYSTEMPLWVFANVTYGLEEPVSGAGYYYGDYTTEKYVVSSLIQLFKPDQLKENGVQPVLGTTPVIETFSGDWEKEWYRYSSDKWEYRTHKVYHPMWKAPTEAVLSLEVRSAEVNRFSVGIDDYAVEVESGKMWREVQLSPSDFTDAEGNELPGWGGIKELRIMPAETLRIKGKNGRQTVRKSGGDWNGPDPEFRNLRWVTEKKVALTPVMPKPTDTTAMWWWDGFPGKTEGADWRRMVKTGHYWFLFDTDTMKVARIGSVDQPLQNISGAELELNMEVDGKVYTCKNGGEYSRFTGPRLIESGRFLQRADVTDLVFQSADGAELNVEARFETAAWPDELGMILAARPGLQSIKPGDESFGIVNGGFGMDGANEYSIPAEHYRIPNAFTLDFRVFIPFDYQAGRASPWLVCKNNHEEHDGNFGILIHSGGVPELIANIGGGRDNSLRLRAEKNHSLLLDQWNHLAVKYDGKVFRLFVNGKSAAELIPDKIYEAKPGKLTFGNRGDNAGDGMFRFRGIVDEIRLFEVALNDHQIHHLYHHPAGDLPHVQPAGKWAFRDDIGAAKSIPRETWKSASMEISLTKGEQILNAKWEMPQGGVWNNGEWQNTGFRFDPTTFKNVPESSPVKVSAKEVATGGNRTVTFDSDIGWHHIDLDGVLPLASPGSAGPDNGAMERVRLHLSNPSGSEETIRMVFAKSRRGIRQDIGVPITGISVVLRDRDGHPTGIPVQLSKNWHFHPEDNSVHSGQWFHGISQVRLPANTDLELELAIVYGHWGGVPAASHSQLSLIGWGGNQRWDQSAIGAWGESICYSPEQNETGSTITDVRPLMVASMKNGEPWGWTKNVGGGDFLTIYDPKGNRIQRSGVMVDYRKQCPCLTEIHYSGGLRGANIHYSQTVSLARTDDLVRGTFRINMKANEPVDFSRFALFQTGADGYAMTRESKLAIGDETGLLSEWHAQPGGNRYRGEPVEMAGGNPWVSLHETEGNGRDEPGAWANRGFVIREWEATLGGKKVSPWIAEYGLDRSGHFQTSIMEIVPPPGVQRLETGDSINATIEFLVIPRSAEDYYGPNQALKTALEKDGDTWRMVHREASKGSLNIDVQKGKLLSRYPGVQIATEGGKAEFAIRGGVGYIPVTFENLKSHRDYILLLDGKEIDQSTHGNDFWQTDYNPRTGCWSRTYTIQTDAEGEQRVQFRGR